MQSKKENREYNPKQAWEHSGGRDALIPDDSDTAKVIFKNVAKGMSYPSLAIFYVLDTGSSVCLYFLLYSS